MKKASQQTVDIAADAVSKAAPADLKSIVDLARTAARHAKTMETLQEQLNIVSKDYFEIMMTTLPERMGAAGLKRFDLDNGYFVTIKEFTNASLPTETAVAEADPAERDALAHRRKEGMAWLTKHGGLSLVKNKLSADFGKGEDAAAKKFFALITKAGYMAKCEESVNHNSLNSFIREKMEQGVEVPSEPFKLFHGKKAEIKQQKPKN